MGVSVDSGGGGKSVDVDINLVPFIDLMSVTISFLIMTAVWTQVGRLEGELQRGISTKMDVRRLLGAPKGTGGSALPPDSRPREVWFYQDIEVTDIRSEGKGILRMNQRQQVLLVFFEKEVFDGFMWFSNAAVATVAQ